MNNVIVGTAGHVDHGKTCLIKALTGVDTDRLIEEKKRGITIDLGFAEMPNDRNLNIGVIDVPGHEKFIKNMLAGIGGIDLVLLVIAADEGIMPQTVEHFEIINMLRVKQGIIVLTKMDLVDEEWLDIVKDDVREFTAGTFLESAPVIEVSSYTGLNIAKLKEMICDMAEKSGNHRKEPELFRLPIDRVFTIDGFGTVVTGTLIEGTVAVGDEVKIYPKGKTAKVRNLQVHGRMVSKAFAGQRTAINLTNIKREDLRRGDVLAVKDALVPSMMLDVKIDMFKNSPRTLESGSRLHLYYGSAEVLCKVVLLDAERLESGQSGFAQLRLEEEIAVRKNDRFILRFYSPLESIGGGVVLDPNPPRRRRYHSETLKLLTVKEKGSGEELLETALIEESRKIPDLKELARYAGLTGEQASRMIEPLLQAGKAVRLTENHIVHRDYIHRAEEKAVELLRVFHTDNPIKQGIPKEEFRRRLGEKLFIKNNRLMEAVIDRMIAGKIIADNENVISLTGFRVKYTPQMQEMRDKIESEYKKRGWEAPETDEVLTLFREKDKTDAVQLLEALRREGRLEKLAYNCYIHTDCLEAAMDLLKKHIKEKGSITLAEYRDLLGTSRKYAVRILEYTDQQKITRLVGDARILIK